MSNDSCTWWKSHKNFCHHKCDACRTERANAFLRTSVFLSRYHTISVVLTFSLYASETIRQIFEILLKTKLDIKRGYSWNLRANLVGMKKSSPAEAWQGFAQKAPSKTDVISARWNWAVRTDLWPFMHFTKCEQMPELSRWMYIMQPLFIVLARDVAHAGNAPEFPFCDRTNPGTYADELLSQYVSQLAVLSETRHNKFGSFLRCTGRVDHVN